ncbi:endonuclease/exonuclease/phosphatase family protein [Mesorhizobium wenxiniae]|uniref:Endonuclease/exonuclease/phosphatase domain-containing protein n=1 Tax=Mesorhizobium wenxiniae TaxID=2014805 RepID=A0A271KI36_9HYPH|nr:endonuclease/exonuclease/phosphatase family protein [Mesorhizobium wenxiniae]PAP95443.1 hypothetical protein CIT31_15705 [Mesorhizobium wenxiniae]
MILPLVLFFALITTGVSAAELTIATFNANFLTRPTVHVKFGYPLSMRAEADLALWTPAFRDQKFAEAAEEVAKVVASLDADIVVLTEVGNVTDLAELNGKITALGVTYPHNFVCQCTDSNTQQKVAVLSKLVLSNQQPSIAGVEGYFEEADDNDSENQTGISKGLSVRFEFAGRPVTLYGAHFVSEGNGPEADEQRIAQASILRRYAIDHIEAGELFMVAGDLNDGRGQPAIRRVQGYDDIWPDLLQTGDTAFFANRDDWDTRWTYEYQGTRNQIDHILLGPEFLQVVKRSDIKTVIPDQPNVAASDHRPVVVTLSTP